MCSVMSSIAVLYAIATFFFHIFHITPPCLVCDLVLIGLNWHGLVHDSSIHLFSHSYDLSLGAICYCLTGTGTQSTSHTSSANWKHFLQASWWAFEAWREWYIFPLLYVLSLNFIIYLSLLCL